MAQSRILTAAADAALVKRLAIGGPVAECHLLDIIFEMLANDQKVLEGGAVEIMNPPWILCIDDDDDYSMALKRHLEAHGIAVVRAAEGRGGLRCAFSHPADVILLDYEMPNGRGDYILGRLKDNVITRNIPVIVITGRKDRLLEHKMIALGTAKFMNKPFDFQELLTELLKHINALAIPALGYSVDRKCHSIET